MNKISNGAEYKAAMGEFRRLNAEINILRDKRTTIANSIEAYENEQYPADVSNLSDAEIRKAATDVGASDEAIERTFGYQTAYLSPTCSHKFILNDPYWKVCSLCGTIKPIRE